MVTLLSEGQIDAKNKERFWMGEQLLFKHPELGKVAPLCGTVDILLSCLIVAGSIGRSEALRCSARSWHTVGLHFGQEDGLSAAGHVG